MPGAVWDALTAHVLDPADRTRLAHQAEWRGLYRYAVDLARPAAEAGEAAAMQLMARRLAAAGHSGEAAEWTRRAAEAGDTMAVQLYAKRLDEDGDRDGADAILAHCRRRWRYLRPPVPCGPTRRSRQGGGRRKPPGPGR